MATSKHQDLPPSPISQVGMFRMGQRAQVTAGLAMAKVLLHTLKQSHDPIVKQIALELEEICILPWGRSEARKLEDGAFENTVVDYYDLTLPTEAQVTIGTYGDDSVQLPETAGLRTHVVVRIVETEGDRVWVAELRAPTGSDDFSTSCMKVGEAVIERKKNTRGFSPQSNDEYQIVVKPGDVIEVGMSHIRLHAPDTAQR